MTGARGYDASVEFLLFVYFTRHPDLACLNSPHFRLSIPTRSPYIPLGLLHFCRPISLVPAFYYDSTKKMSFVHRRLSTFLRIDKFVLLELPHITRVLIQLCLMSVQALNALAN